ncbi:MAG: hypothetical protein QOJ14_132 [Thermoleophilaceae bacterium]|nr:hypothetical protein [Thermoleophilaceae bacterium]
MSAAAYPQLRRRIALTVAAAAALGAMALPASAAARRCHHVNADPNRISIEKAQRATLCLLNRKRRVHGVHRVSENHRLDLASTRYAQDMARHDFFEHGDFVGRIERTNYLAGAGSWTVGENIAWGGGSYATPRSTVEMWMNSPPHRHNILDPHFREIGIGIARGTPVAGVGGATYATDFGARG